jgi:hypothetical protein
LVGCCVQQARGGMGGGYHGMRNARMMLPQPAHTFRHFHPQSHSSLCAGWTEQHAATSMPATVHCGCCMRPCRAWQALSSATRARSLVLFHRGRCIAQLGVAPEEFAAGLAAPGPMCQEAMQSGRGNYMANLALFPGGWCARPAVRLTGGRQGCKGGGWAGDVQYHGEIAPHRILWKAPQRWPLLLLRGLLANARCGSECHLPSSTALLSSRQCKPYTGCWLGGGRRAPGVCRVPAHQYAGRAGATGGQ